MLKRVISILVVCLLLMTATTVGAAAQDTTREAVIDSILEYHHNSITEDDLSYLLYEPLSNGAVFCMWDLKGLYHATVTVPVQLGKYVIDGNNGFGYHVYYQGTLYRIEKAYEIGVLTEEDLESLFASGTLLIYDTVEPDEEADMPDTIDKKTYCTATLDDDFTDNEIIIVMTKPASIIGREYTTSDFAEVDPISVKTLTFDKNIESDIETLTAQYMESYPEYYAQKKALEEVRKKYDTFHLILLLELPEHSKQNVLDCIKILEQRDDILSAEPNMRNVGKLDGAVDATDDKTADTKPATPSSAGKSAAGPAIKTGDTAVCLMWIVLLMCAAVFALIRRRISDE